MSVFEIADSLAGNVFSIVEIGRKLLGSPQNGETSRSKKNFFVSTDGENRDDGLKYVLTKPKTQKAAKSKALMHTVQGTACKAFSTALTRKPGRCSKPSVCATGDQALSGHTSVCKR